MKHIKYFHGSDTSMFDVKILATKLSILPDRFKNQDASQGNVQFISLENNNLRRAPRVTICGIYDDEQNTLNFGVARCSEKDRFIKRIGRELSTERALHNPIMIMKCNDKIFFGNIFIEVAKELSYKYMTETCPIKF